MTDLADRATERPWFATELPKGEGAAAFGRWYVAGEGRGYPGAELEGRRSEADAAFIVYAANNIERVEAELAAALAALGELLGLVREKFTTAPAFDNARRILAQHAAESKP